VLYEALLNICEHAYASKQERVVFGAITATPVPVPAQLERLGFVSDAELEWFAAVQGYGMMLEVSIADYGLTVPATLCLAFENRHPHSLESVKSANLRTHVGKAIRADVQGSIARWAFHHLSTRKTSRDIPNEAAFLNWRGLHRAMNLAASERGCIVMRTGQARTGYCFTETAQVEIHPRNPEKQHEFPGTGLVLRIPIPLNRISVGVFEPSATDADITAIGGFRRCSDAVPLSGGGKPRLICVTHPFRALSIKDISELRRRAVPPSDIEVHTFLRLEPDADADSILASLAAYDRDISLSIFGVPRLISIYDSEQHLHWKFIGLIPEFARAFIRDLESKGYVEMLSDPALEEFGREMVATYSPFLSLQDRAVRLVPFRHRLLQEDYGTALQMAFKEWAAVNPGSWLFAQPGKAVLLPTGRRVEKFVSVLKLLYENPPLAQAIGGRLQAIMAALHSKYHNLALVTDCEASYFIARFLLKGYERRSDIYVGLPKDSDDSERNYAAFVDCISKGQAVAGLLKGTPRCVAAICAVDLRQGNPTTTADSDVSYFPLLRYPFDPKEIADKSLEVNNEAYGVDTVTHIPMREQSAEELLLGTNRNREEFLRDNPDIFRYGMHRSGGRIHVVSLDTEKFIARDRTKLVNWIGQVFLENMREVAHASKLPDVVVFTRNEAHTKDLVEELGKLLGEHGFDNVFNAVLPFVPRGTREVFGRPTPELFQRLRRLTLGQLPLLDEPGPFIALYLDDACVTGKSLLNFLIQTSIAKREQTPLAIMVVPIMSRLSPAEEFFYTKIISHTTGQNNDLGIPFYFRPLFRLQVRSYETLEATPAFQLLSELLPHKLSLIGSLREYVEALESAFLAEFLNIDRDKEPVSVRRHPFHSVHSSSGPPVSIRAVHIRHLIALQEQNAGVMRQLLQEVLVGCLERDHTLCTMIAVEPILLGIPPLQRECSSDITTLALDAVRSSECDAGTKSDALIVLFAQGVSAEVLVALVPSLTDHRELIDQLLVSVLLAIRKGTLRSGNLLVSLEEHSSSIAPELYGHVEASVKSFEQSTRATYTNYLEASRSIAHMVAYTSYHGAGVSVLKVLTTWLTSDESERDVKPGSAVRDICDAAVSLVENELLTALDALMFWAQYNGDDHVRGQLGGQIMQLTTAVNHFKTYVRCLPEGAVGKHVVENIATRWKQVREHSVTRATIHILSKRLTSNRVEVLPPIDCWLPRYFCLPVEVVSELAVSRGLTMEPTLEWDRKQLALVPISFEVVARLFDLLLTDMEQHGRPETFKVHFSIDAPTELVVIFTNAVRTDDKRRTGRSQTEAKEMAMRYGFSILFDAGTPPGKVYRSEIRFPGVLVCEN